MTQDMNLQIKIEGLTKQAQEAFAEISESLKDISSSAKNVDGPIRKAERSVEKLGKSFQDAGKKIDDMGRSINAVGKELSLKLTAPLVAFGALATKAFADASDDAFRLENALRVMGRSSDGSLKSLNRLAEEFQKLTRFSFGATQNAAGLASQFTKSSEETERLVRAAAELATITGVDLNTAVRQLGQTYQGQAGLLGRQFRELNNFTTAQLEAGEAVRFFNEQFGGSAVAAAQTFTGQLVQTKNEIQALLEVIGEDLSPLVTKLNQGLKSIAITLQNLDQDTRKNIIGFGLIAAAIGPILIAVGSLVRVVGFAVKGLGTLLVAAKPLLAIFSAKGALVVGIIALAGSLAGAVNLFLDLRKAGVQTGEAIGLVFKLIGQFIADKFLGLLGSILQRMSGIIGFFNSAFGELAKIAGDGLEGLSNTIGKSFDGTKEEIDRRLEGIGKSAASSFTFGLSERLAQLSGVLNESGQQAGRDLGDGVETGFKEKTETMFDFIKSQAELIGRTISGNLASSFLDVVEGAKSAREAFADFARQTIRWILQMIIQQQIFNSLKAAAPGFFSAGGAVGGAQPQAFASGGKVSGPGTGTSDSIPAFLSNGEFVINARTVRKFGTGFFYGLQSLASKGIPRFADGGMVAAGGMGGQQIIIENRGSPKEATGTEQDPVTGVITVMLDDITKNGPISKGMQNTFGLRRGGFR